MLLDDSLEPFLRRAICIVVPPQASDDQPARRNLTEDDGLDRLRMDLDDQPLLSEHPSRIFEGMDHAPGSHSSQRPRKEDHIELAVREWQRFCSGRLEADPALQAFRDRPSGPGEGLPVRIQRHQAAGPLG